MPVYTYEVLNKDGTTDEPFEVLQKMSDPPLREHPETGQPVRRVFRAPNIGGEWGEVASRRRLSDENLSKHGFTKYSRVGKGQFERRTGSFGPPQIDVK